MIFIILYWAGFMLFVNGLLLLGMVSSFPGVAALNFLVGTLITVIAMYITMTDMYKAFGETESSSLAAACFSFSIAYLMIALEVWTKGDFTVLGWYCLPVSACLFSLALGYFGILGKKLPKVSQFGVLHLCWAVCFFLFWLRFGAQLATVGPLTGWVIIIVGLITCSYPALAYFQAGKVGQW